jgi:hypothetical protein
MTEPSSPAVSAGVRKRRWLVPLVAALVIGGAACLLFMVMIPQVEESGRRAACKGNLRIIGIGLHLYARDNGGDFAPKLTDIYPKYVEYAHPFSCPSKPARLQDLENGSGGEESCSYVYLPGRFAGLPGTFVVAYDRPENHRNRGMNVMTVDSSVAWYRAEHLPELRKTLAEQEAQFVELRRKWEEQKAADAPVVEAFLRRLDKHAMVDLKNVLPEEGLKYIMALAEVSVESDGLPAMAAGKTVTLQQKDAPLAVVLDSWCSQVGADWTIAETGGGAPGLRKLALVVGKRRRIDELNQANLWIAGLVERYRAKVSVPETGK